MFLRMDHQRIPQQALYWKVPGYDRGPGRWRVNWRSAVNKDLQKMGFTSEAALDRHGWRWSVAQCVQLDAGWIKVKGQSSSSKRHCVTRSCEKNKIQAFSVYDKVYRYNQYICSLLQSAVTTKQWRNDGVAAASRDGGTVKGAPDISKFLMINF